MTCQSWSSTCSRRATSKGSSWARRSGRSWAPARDRSHPSRRRVEDGEVGRPLRGRARDHPHGPRQPRADRQGDGPLLRDADSSQPAGADQRARAEAAGGAGLRQEPDGNHREGPSLGGHGPEPRERRPGDPCPDPAADRGAAQRVRAAGQAEGGGGPGGDPQRPPRRDPPHRPDGQERRGGRGRIEARSRAAAEDHRGPGRARGRPGGPQGARSSRGLGRDTPVWRQACHRTRVVEPLGAKHAESGLRPRRYSLITLDPSVPRHIGIIMDGNGRWARSKGHPVSFGHRAGVRAIKRVLDGCEKLGVEVLSVYAFSTENWSRPRAEVRALMRLFHETMQREIDEMHRRGVRIVVSGRRDELSQRMRERIDEAIARTSRNTNGMLNVCLNYGGRAEIVDAVRQIVSDGIAASDVDEAAISARMYNPELPDPDLIIRTAGERRVSNFLLWQGAYSEMLVSETLWPDYDEVDLKAALADYASRVRRFGGRPDDVTA